MTEQQQLAKTFLEALFALDEKQEDSKKLFRALQAVKTVVERGLPLNEVIAARLMTGLTINFRFWAKKSTNEIQLISPENEKGDVVEEHLLVLFVQVLRSTIDRHIKLLNVAKEPECMIVLLDTSLEMVRNKQKELLLAVLELVLTLVKSLLSERAEFVEKIFPSTLSTLFNLVLNQQAETKSVKAKQLALKVVTELLYAHFQKKPHLPTKLILSLPGEKHSNDSTLDHITRYLDTLTRNIETLGLQEKYQEIEELVRRVLLSPGSHTSGLLPYIYRLAYTVDVSPDLSLESEYNRSVVSESLRDELRLQIGLLSSRSKNLMNSQEQLKRMKFVGRTLSTPQFSMPYEESNKLLGQLLAALRTEFNPKVRLTLNSTIVPLEKLTGQSRIQPALQVSLRSSYRSVRQTQLLNSFKLFQSESTLLHAFEALIEGASEQIAAHWIQQLVERLQQCTYDVQMNLHQLSEYLALVYVLSLVTKHRPSQLSHFSNIYSSLKQSQPLTELKISYEEEELLVVMSLEALSNCHQRLKSSCKNKLNAMNYKLAMTEILLGLSDEEVYSMTLLSNILLLKLSDTESVGEFLLPLVPTVFHRNPRHIKLLTALVRLTANNFSEQFAEKVAADYYLLRHTEEMMMLLVPKLSTNLARRCLLAMSDDARWIEALLANAQYLAQQPMKNETNEEMTTQPFYSNDPQNSSVSDCLGVVVLELGVNRWQSQLEGKRCGRVLDLILRMFQINPHMIFFRNLYELFPSLQKQFERLADSVQSYALACNVQKILTLLKQYYSDDQLKRMKVKGSVLVDLTTSLEILLRKIKMELYTAQHHEKRLDILKELRDLGEVVTDLICKSCDQPDKDPQETLLQESA